MGELNKIIITEEQAKVIEQSKNNDYKEDRLVSIYSSTENLDLVTIARIVEGELYEVIRPLKVGDIVISEWGKVIQIVEEVTNDSDKLSINTVNNSDFKYTLVCKVENREDLKDGRMHKSN